jgi:hypothetical protein
VSGVSDNDDLRFPELSRVTGDGTLDVVPAARVCSTGRAHGDRLRYAGATETPSHRRVRAPGGIACRRVDFVAFALIY